jgi:hypothetical protein
MPRIRGPKTIDGETFVKLEPALAAVLLDMARAAALTRRGNDMETTNPETRPQEFEQLDRLEKAFDSATSVEEYEAVDRAFYALHRETRTAWLAQQEGSL